MRRSNEQVEVSSRDVPNMVKLRQDLGPASFLSYLEETLMGRKISKEEMEDLRLTDIARTACRDPLSLTADEVRALGNYHLKFLRRRRGGIQATATKLGREV